LSDILFYNGIDNVLKSEKSCLPCYTYATYRRLNILYTVTLRVQAISLSL